MSQRYSEICKELKNFAIKQKIFFVTTAGRGGRVNISPKGMDTLRILGSNRVIWLNLTGSGNETSVHVQENGRMTLMFCAFEGKPMILRFYGKAKVIHPRDAEWSGLIKLFPKIAGSRQIFDLSIDLVQRSCGMGVPFFDFVTDRRDLKEVAENKGEEGIRKYWEENNAFSLDGKSTNIV
ncbi:MAG TPA: pyridoxamine 5'-phosphate oxidase family protein [Desulfobacterales bacterium]|nr:pyridoxamine 5'-phosphate oxidase family protein [Desulfobacterales bacterium]